tara:strand:+ start:2596 stop:2817 length:222 start_codon:yes stop_codon:yes gene_type:complete
MQEQRFCGENTQWDPVKKLCIGRTPSTSQIMKKAEEYARSGMDIVNNTPAVDAAESQPPKVVAALNFLNTKFR